MNMVYQKGTKVHGKIYWELVRCERDEKGEPKQEHLQYLGKQKISPALLQNYNKYFGELKEHAIARFKNALIKVLGNDEEPKIHDYNSLITRLHKKSGISKNIIENILEAYIDKKVLLMVELNSSENKQITFEEAQEIYRVHITEGFSLISAEKVYRLTRILELLQKEAKFKDMVFYGGTALNFLPHKKCLRLSVDLDFTFIGKKPNREEIISSITSILKSLNYEESKIIRKDDERAELVTNLESSYTDLHGNNSSIQFDLNFKEKETIFPLDVHNFNHPYENLPKFKVKSYSLEELYGAKFNAMLERTHPRDIFDLHNMPKKLDLKKIKKAFIYDTAVKGTDLTKYQISSMDQQFEDKMKRGIDQTLFDMLRTGEKPNLKKMYSDVRELVSTMLKLTKEEQEEHKKKLRIK